MTAGGSRGPLVSVVIPNHDYARFVGDAIESVLAQTYAPIEVIVVDNGSSDGSLRVLERYADRCRIVAQEDRGQSGARDCGISEARGELVAFLDADDAWRPEKLERQVERFTDERVGLVYCSLMFADERLRPTGRILRAAYQGDILEEFARRPGEGIVIGGESSAVVRRAVLDAVGGFEPTLSISAGWDMWRRIATRYRVECIGEPLVLYRQHGGGQHRRLRAYEADVRAAAARMFADPAAARIHHLRRAHEAGLDLMFAKAHLRAGDLARALSLAIGAIANGGLAARRR